MPIHLVLSGNPPSSYNIHHHHTKSTNIKQHPPTSTNMSEQQILLFYWTSTRHMFYIWIPNVPLCQSQRDCHYIQLQLHTWYVSPYSRQMTAIPLILHSKYAPPCPSQRHWNSIELNFKCSTMHKLKPFNFYSTYGLLCSR